MSTLLASYTSTGTYSFGYSGTLLAQTFVVPSGYDRIDDVRVPLIRIGTVAGNVTAHLYATSGGYPTGSSLGSKTITASTIGTSGADWTTFTFASPISVTGGARYAIVFDGNGSSSSATVAWWRGSTAGYSGGAGFYKYSGGSWVDWSKDFAFYVYGSVSVTAPTVTTTAPADITATSVTMAGNVTDDGGGTVSAKGYVYSTTDSTPDKNEETTYTDGSGTGAFSQSITGLSPNTLYYMRAWATNQAGTAYGAVNPFTTLATTPTVVSGSASNISSTTATCSGNVTSNGGSTVTTRGVCYNTTGTPTTANDIVASGGGNGTFSSNLTGLTAGTTYYWRAYATNAEGTVYGTEYSFVTKTIVTQWGQSFTTTSAGTLFKVSLLLKETLGSSSTATVKIYSDDSNPDAVLATSTKTITGSTYTWYDFTFNLAVDASTVYWIVLDTPYVVGLRHQFWGYSTTGTYGDLAYSVNNGSSWSAGSGTAAFYEYVQPSLSVEYNVSVDYRKKYL